MLEISPVTAGHVYDAPVNVAANVNFNRGSATSADALSDNSAVPDAERYSKFDRSASKTGDAGMSFGDLLDMINPLQHIPIVSSVYREITGEKINPVARVAGDIMYGGMLGVASAIIGGVGGIADSVMEAETGKDFVGTVYASLFGDDADKAGDAATQLADKGGTATMQAAAATPPNSASSSAMPAPSIPGASTTVAASSTAAASSPALVAQQGIPLANKSFALTPNGLPYGGALAPVRSMQEQNMAMALASSAGVRVGNTIYTNRLINGPHPLPLASPASAASAPTMVATPSAPFKNTYVMAPPATTAAMAAPPALTEAQQAIATTITPTSPLTNYSANTMGFTPLPSGLSDDAMMMKALGLYKNVAGRAGSNAGSGLNVLN